MCMTILPDPIAFEWDRGNAQKNERKHKVTIKEAEETFENSSRFLFVDERHSGRETRYGMYGRTNSGRLLSLVFTIREDFVRIITVRPMSRKERKAYEKIKADTNI